jgi:chorismate-pyruvate lyase
LVVVFMHSVSYLEHDRLANEETSEELPCLKGEGLVLHRTISLANTRGDQACESEALLGSRASHNSNLIGAGPNLLHDTTKPLGHTVTVKNEKERKKERKKDLSEKGWLFGPTLEVRQQGKADQGGS